MAGFFHAQGVELSPVGQVLLRVTHPAGPVQEGLSPTVAASEDMLDEVDSALGRHRTEFPSPLVIAGTAELVDAFCRTSRHLHRLAGRITDANTPEAMQQLAARALESYLRSRGQEALQQVDQAATQTPHLVATGLDECWVAAHQAPPSLLAVEQGYAQPGHHFAPFDTNAAPEDRIWLHDLHDDPFLVHDLVDDLVEAVINRGGWVAFVPDGALADRGRVALVTEE